MKSQPMESSAFADSVTVTVSAKADDSIGWDFISLSFTFCGNNRNSTKNEATKWRFKARAEDQFISTKNEPTLSFFCGIETLLIQHQQPAASFFVEIA